MKGDVSLLEEYYKNKINYKEYIILMKYGNFYEIVGQDALIMNKIFNYKISKLSNSFKVGFPVSNVDEVLDKLEELFINYVVFNKNEILFMKKFDNNKYNDYVVNEDIIRYNLILINYINDYLNNNLLNNDISNKLERIKDIINE